MSDSVRPHRWQPSRLSHPWDSPGKNTGVGCHFLLQGMKVESESEVAQSCLTLSDPMDCSLPGSSVHWIFQARVGCHCVIRGCCLQLWKRVLFSLCSPYFPHKNFLSSIFWQLLTLIASEKAMAPHSSTLAWKIPWTEEPGRLQSMGS